MLAVTHIQALAQEAGEHGKLYEATARTQEILSKAAAKKKKNCSLLFFV